MEAWNYQREVKQSVKVQILKQAIDFFFFFQAVNKVAEYSLLIS